MTKSIAVPPYTRSASIYDGMMEHVEYEQWARYLDSIFAKHGTAIHRVCELACGTGTIGIKLSRLGYRMTCSDRSEEMVKRALAKARASGVEVEFVVCDMTEFHYSQPFDAVLCLYDSVNYLMEEKDVRTWLSICSELVTDQGLVIFDSCTEINSLEHFDERFELDRRHQYIRRSRYIREERMQVNEVEVTVGGIQYIETHRQRIYSVPTLQDLIHKEHFNILAMYEDLSFDPGTEQSERIHWVLRKNRSYE